jgi:hypothetical protein
VSFRGEFCVQNNFILSKNHENTIYIFSICLPMEVKDLADMTYIVTVLVLNGLGFIIVVICYIQIYLNLGNQDFTKPHASNRDMVVAKKMALLVSLCKVCVSIKQ